MRGTPDFEVRAAIEGAAEANNARQTPLMGAMKAGSSSVGKHRVANARHIIGRFLELVPEDLTVQELRWMLEEQMPVQFVDMG